MNIRDSEQQADNNAGSATPGTSRERASSVYTGQDTDVVLEGEIFNKRGAGCPSQQALRPQRGLYSQLSRTINLCSETGRAARILKRMLKSSKLMQFLNPSDMDEEESAAFSLMSENEERSACCCKKTSEHPPQLEKMTTPNRDGFEQITPPQSSRDTDDLGAMAGKSPHVPGVGELQLLQELIANSSQTEASKNQSGSEKSVPTTAKRRPYNRKQPYTRRRSPRTRGGKQPSGPSREELEGTEQRMAEAGLGNKTPPANGQGDMNDHQLIAYISPYPIGTDPSGERVHTLCQVWQPRTRADFSTGHPIPENAKLLSDRLKNCYPPGIQPPISDLVNMEGRQPPALHSADKNYHMLLQNRAADESGQGFYNKYQGPVPNGVFMGRPPAKPNQYGDCLPVHRQMLHHSGLFNDMGKYAAMMGLCKNNKAGE